MVEQTPNGEQVLPSWSIEQLAEYVEEVRRRDAELDQLMPWLIADSLLLDAIDLYRAAVREQAEECNHLLGDGESYRELTSQGGRLQRGHDATLSC
jgi:hypothetical protein